MNEYIDREAAVDAVTGIYYDTPEINLTAEKFEEAINGIPAAELRRCGTGGGREQQMELHYALLASGK